MTGPTGWAFLSNHAHVLICIAQEPDIRLCDLAERVRITPTRSSGSSAIWWRPAICLASVEAGGNRYEVHLEEPLRHPIGTPSGPGRCST